MTPLADRITQLKQLLCNIRLCQLMPMQVKHICPNIVGTIIKIMEQNVYSFSSLIIEGTTEKVLLFKMPLMLIYNNICYLSTQKCVMSAAKSECYAPNCTFHL